MVVAWLTVLMCLVAVLVVVPTIAWILSPKTVIKLLGRSVYRWSVAHPKLLRPVRVVGLPAFIRRYPASGPLKPVSTKQALAIRRLLDGGMAHGDHELAPMDPVREVRMVDVPIVLDDQPAALPVMLIWPESRVYKENSAHGDLLGITIYLHGGGFVGGSPATHEGLARILANESQTVVAVPAYSLAPEARYPRALRECYELARWLRDNAATELGGLDGTAIALAGDSAGGSLAVAMLMMARDDRRHGAPDVVTFKCALLYYPMLAYSWQMRSHLEHGDGYMITTRGLRMTYACYLPPDLWHELPAEKSQELVQSRHPYASPLTHDVSQLPPMMIFTAELDPLCSEGAFFAERLRSEGNLGTYGVRHIQCFGETHGFVGAHQVSATGRAAICKGAAYLRERI